jgi:hypothetical protein
MKTIVALIVICGLTPYISDCQIEHAVTRFELSGTVGYTYTYQSRQWGIPYNFLEYKKSHDIFIQPALGYFVSSELEVLLEPRYTVSYYEYNALMGYTNNVKYNYWRHNVALGIGVIYNYFFYFFRLSLFGYEVRYGMDN